MCDKLEYGIIIYSYNECTRGFKVVSLVFSRSIGTVLANCIVYQYSANILYIPR